MLYRASVYTVTEINPRAKQGKYLLGKKKKQKQNKSQTYFKANGKC